MAINVGTTARNANYKEMQYKCSFCQELYDSKKQRDIHEDMHIDNNGKFTPTVPRDLEPRKKK